MVGYDKITLGKTYSTIDDDAWEFYKKHTKRTKIKKKIDFTKIISITYNKAAEAIIEQKEGVYAKGFFYIVGHHFPKNLNKMKLGAETRYCFETDRRVFTIMFDNLMKGSKKYLPWTMKNCFTKRVHKMFSDFLLKHNPTYRYNLSNLD